jgi:hypothetical protein
MNAPLTRSELLRLTLIATKYSLYLSTSMTIACGWTVQITMSLTMSNVEAKLASIY